MTNSREEEELLYEQEEVLWAKIRGYPWWPAFVTPKLKQVDKVHAPMRGKESEYTVFFFGDNTQYPSSKLGASKLRKFYENYTEFYQKARAHRKLMASIQMAEEKLKQNDQNVEIFQELRNNLKVIRKERSKSPLNRKQSKISQPDPEPSPKKEEPPELSKKTSILDKSKTYAHPRGRRSLAHKEQPAHIQEEQSSHKHKTSPAKQEATVSRQPDKTVKKEFRKQEVTPSPPKRRNQAKQQIFEEVQQPKTTKIEAKELKATSPQKEKPVQKIVQQEANQQAEQSEQMDVEARSESIEEEEPQEDESEDIIYQKKLRNKVNRSSQDHKATGHRKRGRPKKRLLRHHSHHLQEKVELSSRNQTNRVIQIKRKIIHKARPSPRKVQAAASSLSQSDSLIIEHVRRILHRREELVQYLGNISITINNVQEILDLGVSNILQDGDKTLKITEILFILRNVLLYKYFPEDVKHRKKYEQILRKKPVVIKNDDKEKQKENEKEKMKDESEEERQDQSIRKKTIVKLEKFLKAHPDVQSKARELAIKIESYFQKADGQVGEIYKSLAFKVLSTLKERKESCSEVLKKLEHHAYD